MDSDFLIEYKKFVQRIGLIGTTNILIALSSLILLPILTKNLSINDYGIWIQITTTIVLIPNIATLGLPYTFIRYFSAETNKKKIQEGFYSIAFISIISTFIISILLLVFSKSIASAIFNNNINIVLVLIIIIFFASINSLLINYFRTFQQMKIYSIFLLIQTYTGVLVVSYFVINGSGIYEATLGLLISYLISFLIMIFFIISSIGFKIPKFEKIREYLSFGLPTIPGNLSYWMVDSSDRYIIGLLLGTSFVGYYSPGYTLGNIIIMFLAPFSLLLPSILPKYYDENNIDMVKIFLNYSLKYFLLIAIPSTFGLSLLSKPILMILTTPDIALNGYLITPFITFSTLLFGIYAIISNIVVLNKKTKIIGTVWVLAAFSNLLLNILIVPYFGIIGAAAVTLFAYIIAFGLTFYYTNKYFEFRLNLNFIFKSVFSSIIMSILIIRINPISLLNIILTVFIAFVIYMVTLFLLKGIKTDELKFFKSIFLKDS
jgi:O-antigen/teichoic acid export membrane protein